jgi:hypothetical protein
MQEQSQDQGSQRRGYQGLCCQCARCQALTPQERQEKYRRIQAARSAGGKTRAAQSSMQEARSKGFFTTCWKRGYGLWLKKKIKGQNELRQRKAAMRTLIAQRPAGRRQPM